MNTQQAVATAYPVVCFGEILWDVLPSGAKPGGAPMNVAYHLQKLQLPTAVITRIGNDERGARLLELLRANDTTTAYIQQDAMQPTGVVLATLNEKAEATYDIVRPVAWDFIEWHEDLKKLVSGAAYFVFGSLATRNDASRNTLFRLLEHAQTNVFDINLRPPHFSQAGIEALLQHCQILKINDSELKLVSGWYGHLKTLEDQMALLQDRFKIETLVTTCGSNGALLCSQGIIYRHSGFQVPVKDTVGSGDAFLAALLYQLQQQAPAEQALEFANAFGAFVASCEGAWPVYDVADVIAKMKNGFLEQPHANR